MRARILSVVMVCAGSWWAFGDDSSPRHIESLKVGGGYGVTGASITSAGAGSFNGALTSDGAVTGSTLVSTVATGTAPLTVASTTVVPNLNASALGGGTWASPSAIGTGTPAAVTGTTVTAMTGVVTPQIGASSDTDMLTLGNQTVQFRGETQMAGYGTTTARVNTRLYQVAWSSAANWWQVFSITGDDTIYAYGRVYGTITVNSYTSGVNHGQLNFDVHMYRGAPPVVNWTWNAAYNASATLIPALRLNATSSTTYVLECYSAQYTTAQCDISYYNGTFLPVFTNIGVVTAGLISDTTPAQVRLFNGTPTKLTGDLLVDGGDIGITADPDLLGLAANKATVNGTLAATVGVDVGDAGGFSGMKFNATTTELEFWIDGAKVGHIGLNGSYVDDV